MNDSNYQDKYIQLKEKMEGLAKHLSEKAEDAYRTQKHLTSCDNTSYEIISEMGGKVRAYSYAAKEIAENLTKS